MAAASSWSAAAGPLMPISSAKSRKARLVGQNWGWGACVCVCHGVCACVCVVGSTASGSKGGAHRTWQTQAAPRRLTTVLPAREAARPSAVAAALQVERSWTVTAFCASAGTPGERHPGGPAKAAVSFRGGWWGGLGLAAMWVVAV